MRPPDWLGHCQSKGSEAVSIIVIYQDKIDAPMSANYTPDTSSILLWYPHEYRVVSRIRLAGDLTDFF